MLNTRLALVVDDDRQILDFMRKMIDQDGFETLGANGGVQALRTIERLEGKIDLLVTDVQMPEGDGLTLACAVRALYPGIPILLVSGRPQTDTRFPFLEKPFSSVALIEMVRSIVAMTATANGKR
jgi:two-component system cell cycle sensor histidine kinase/response regulator CckA